MLETMLKTGVPFRTEREQLVIQLADQLLLLLATGMGAAVSQN
jgi:hypothetical protein